MLANQNANNHGKNAQNLEDKQGGKKRKLMDPYLGKYETLPDNTTFDGIRRKFSISKEFNNVAQTRVMYHFQQIANIFGTYGMDSVPTGNCLISLSFLRLHFLFSFLG